MQPTKTFWDAFFDGFGPAGLFFRLERPGEPTKVFAEEGDELSDDLCETLRELGLDPAEFSPNSKRPHPEG